MNASLNKFILDGVNVITNSGELGLALWTRLPMDSTAFYVNAQRSDPTYPHPHKSPSPLSNLFHLFEYPDPTSGIRLFHASSNALEADSKGSCLTYSKNTLPEITAGVIHLNAIGKYVHSVAYSTGSSLNMGLQCMIN